MVLPTPLQASIANCRHNINRKARRQRAKVTNLAKGSCRWLHGIQDENKPSPARPFRTVPKPNVHSWLHGAPNNNIRALLEQQKHHSQQPANPAQSTVAQTTVAQNTIAPLLEEQPENQDNAVSQRENPAEDASVSDESTEKDETVIMEEHKEGDMQLKEQENTSNEIGTNQQPIQEDSSHFIVHISICDGDPDLSHTLFKVSVVAPQAEGPTSREWCLDKRFSEFLTFYQRVSQDMKGITFPPKLLWHSSENIEERRNELQCFINEMLTRPMTDDLWSELQLFLDVGHAEEQSDDFVLV